MKRVFLMTLAVLATLVVASCSKENEPDTNYPLEGEWELYMFKDKHGTTKNYGWWVPPRNCVSGIYATFTDRTFIYYNVYSANGQCTNRHEYWDYTKVGNELHFTKSANATWKGQANSMKAIYQMKNGELILTFSSSKDPIIFVLRRRNADYSHLDPFVGSWVTTKVVINGTEYMTREGQCLRGAITVMQDQFTLSLRNEKCQQEDLTRPWVKRGKRYYSVNPNGDKELEIEFLNGNRELKLSVPEAKAVLYFEKAKR